MLVGLPMCIWSDNDEISELGRALIVFSVMFYFIRLLNIFTVHKVFGPKLVMIGRMIKDVMVIWTMLIVIVIAYGIVTQALMDPKANYDLNSLYKILQLTHWTMFGEFESTVNKLGK